MYSKSIQKLIDLFSKFPTVGPRAASRFVFYLLGASNDEIEELAKTILNLKNSVKICRFCFKPFESDKELCEICSNNARDKKLFCIVANETDLVAIEKTKKYKGLYFILGGTVSKLKKEDIEGLRIAELIARIKDPAEFGITNAEFNEIIIATNPTADGETTALYLERVLKPLNKKITRLGRGLPVGGELEYADEETLSSALEGRK
ncbi:MAG: recombination protein RecR [Candidatus Nealsonbacteria bacterium CG_4_10_14_0_2_um_filter_38_17]|uniref:Recombination protein RecR n=2 Tax=Candidatus Nealsoniibacteriota TaxID=1817911 RepID=A0A2M7UZ77_9BACT|nr:MAG: recombination protein RecR [Candidatus Nealsonbacteria bacterium CG23_combo_of_CG06-09_8_20_14_all_38_19]PIZ89277.1 MAG: recombination protein RecR [Candidatus Nealsonbacteria bacterium CG_4_10_14_0_2_um_filter_38_17]